MTWGMVIHHLKHAYTHTHSPFIYYAYIYIYIYIYSVTISQVHILDLMFAEAHMHWLGTILYYTHLAYVGFTQYVLTVQSYVCVQNNVMTFALKNSNICVMMCMNERQLYMGGAGIVCVSLCFFFLILDTKKSFKKLCFFIEFSVLHFLLHFCCLH